MSFFSEDGVLNGEGDYIWEIICKIKLMFVYVLFMDCIYDNEIFVQKCDVCDILLNVVFVNMCVSVIGSVMGYDEIYFKFVDFVNEICFYIFELFGLKFVQVGGGKNGIGGVKKLMN